MALEIYNNIRYIPHIMKSFLFYIAFVFVILFSNIALAERLAVSSSVANIRTGPGENYSILWKVGKYYPVLIMERSGDWFKIRNYEGHEGWIDSSLVGNIATVITKTAKCNIRSAPSTFESKLVTVNKGVPFKVIRDKGEWLNIKHSGGLIGWIHKSLVW